MINRILEVFPGKDNARAATIRVVVRSDGKFCLVFTEAGQRGGSRKLSVVITKEGRDQLVAALADG